MWHGLIAVWALCLCAGSALGEADPGGPKVYFVATDGKDSNPGTLNEPWRTLRKANQTLEAGDTVYVRGGTYEERSPGNAIIAPENSGAPGKYITYAAYQDEIPIINAPEGQMVLSAIDLRGKSYIRIDGFRMGGPQPGKKWSGVKFWVNMRGTRMVAEHNIIQNCYFDAPPGGKPWSGILLAPAREAKYGQEATVVGRCRYNKILNNVIIALAHPNDLIYLLPGSSYNLIEGNLLVGGVHNGIELQGHATRTVTRNIIRNNIIVNRWHTGINIYTSAHGNLIDGNIVLDCGEDHAKNMHGSERDRKNPRHLHGGIIIGAPENIIRHNVLINNGDFAVESYPGHRTSVNNRIYRNTVNRNHYGIYTNSSMPTYGNVFKNNIVCNSVVWSLSRDVSRDKRQDDYFINNDFFGGRFRVRAFGVNSVSDAEQNLPLLWCGNLAIDPKFVEEERRDLRLEAGSPMIDNGAFLTRTISSGKGTKVDVEDARYFMDGWGITDGDLIQLEGETDTARITHVDYEKNSLTMDRPLRWRKGQGVSLPYFGSAPDIGAYEFTKASAKFHAFSRIAERHFRATLKATFNVPPSPSQ